MIRKLHILQELSENRSQWLSSHELALRIGVSDKTIQTDIRKLNDELSEYKATIIAKQGYGYQLKFDNSKLFETYLSTQNDNITMCRNFSEEKSRVMHILFRFFNAPSYIMKETLLKELFVSESRMTKDLNRVREILDNYKLVLKVRPRSGMKISGKESDKRRCIIHENININSLLYDEQEIVKRVSNIVIETFTDNRYIASDIVIQNLIVHIAYTVKRMSQLCFLKDDDVEHTFSLSHEYHIASGIMNRVGHDFNVNIPEAEIINLAINIKGKRNYTKATISEDIDDLTIGLFQEVFNRYKIDLRNQVENRIALSLHIVSLIHRAKYNFSLSNDLNEDIKLNYPLGYDLAIVLAKKIEDKYSIEIVEEELGFLAVHLVKAIEDNRILHNNKRVLIICPYRSGETLLLRHNFLSMFSHLVSTVDITNLIGLSQIDGDAYDLVFTTYSDASQVPVPAYQIHYFLEPKDVNTIKYALYDSDTEDMCFFNESLFTYFDKRVTKDTVLKHLSKITMHENPCDEDLYEAILRRDSLGNTVFGNGIALYHPDHLISEKTTVTIGILRYPLVWNRSERVRIILVLCGSKNDEKQLPILFDKVSSIMRDKEALNQLIREPNPDVFSSIIDNH